MFWLFPVVLSSSYISHCSLISKQTPTWVSLFERLPHWGSHQPLKWFFPHIAKLTFRLLPSTADPVFFSPKICFMCNHRWYSGEVWAWIASGGAEFKVSCLMLILCFWGKDTRSRIWKAVVGKMDCCLFDCWKGNRDDKPCSQKLQCVLVLLSAQFSEGSNRRKISLLWAQGTWGSTGGMLESQGWTRDEKKIAKEIAGPSFSFL